MNTELEFFDFESKNQTDYFSVSYFIKYSRSHINIFLLTKLQNKDNNSYTQMAENK